MRKPEIRTFLISMRHMDRLLKPLYATHSFVRAKSAASLSAGMLSDDDKLFGAYVNNPDDFILISKDGISWMRHDTLKFLPFEMMSGVRMPDDNRPRCVLISLHDGSEVVLEILNDTEEIADFYPWHEFLNSVIFFPQSSEDIERIREIRSLRDVRQYVTEQSYGVESGVCDIDCDFQLSDAIRSGFPQHFILKALDIDPDLLDRPDVCRLLALFLVRQNVDFFRNCDQREAAIEYEAFGVESTEEHFVRKSSVPGPLPQHILRSISAGVESMLEAAQSEGANLKHDTVQLTDILLAIAVKDPQMLSEKFKRKGMTAQAVRIIVASADLQTGKPIEPFRQFDSTSINLMYQALDERDQRGDKKIRIDHVVEALVKVNDSKFLAVIDQFEIQ
ncbi:MAG TPA: hypothetical protein V6C72_16620 [Chroococcales cyanobacterium]